MSTHKSGATTIVFDDSKLLASINDTLRDAPRIASRRLGTAAYEVRDAAVAQWPVDTGESRDAIAVSERISKDSATARISCDVDYVQHISGDPWNRLVAEPLDATIDAVGRDVVAALEAALSRRT